MPLHRESLNYLFEPTCAHARWAHMQRFLPLTGPKLLDNNSSNSYLSKAIPSVRCVVQFFCLKCSCSLKTVLHKSVKHLKPSLKVTILPGGLMSTSSCFINIYDYGGGESCVCRSKPKPKQGLTLDWPSRKGRLLVDWVPLYISVETVGPR